MTIRKIFLSMEILFFLSGCINFTTRMNEHSNSPYNCTKTACEFVSMPFIGKTGEYDWAYAIGCCFWPLWVIDVPCECVIDTLALPFDIHHVLKNEVNSHKKETEHE